MPQTLTRRTDCHRSARGLDRRECWLFSSHQARWPVTRRREGATSDVCTMNVNDLARRRAMPSKVYQSAAEAVADIADGATLAVGGFGLCGIPDQLIEALAESSATDLEVFSNNCGVDGVGLGVLLSLARVRRVTASYVGEN